MAQDAKPQRNQLAQSLMMRLLQGGGNGDPYQNEKSGPFATSPRISGGASPAAAARTANPSPADAAGSPDPVNGAPAKTGGGGGGGAKKAAAKAATGPNNVPLPGTATSPSSLIQTPPQENATSPSSLMQNPGSSYAGQAMPPPPNTAAYAANPLRSAVDAAGVPPPYPGATPATGNTIPSINSMARPYSPTPPTAALNMASGAGNGMGGNQFNVPSPEPLGLHQPATGNIVPSTINPRHTISPGFFNKRPNKLAMPQPYGGPMAAADQSPQAKTNILNSIAGGLVSTTGY